LKTIKELEERAQELCDQATAITTIAEQEQREVTDEERQTINGHLAEVDKVKADLVWMRKLEAAQAEIAASRAAAVRQSEANAITVPASVKRHAKLKAFRGDLAEERAYSCGQWLLATFGRDEHAAQFCRDHGIQASMSGGSNMLGGVLVPDEFENAVIDLREERGVFRRNCRVRPMAGDTLIIPRRTGGLTGYYVGDNTEITASDKGWDNVQLTARKLGVLAKWSSELNEDAVISLADDLASEIAYAFANAEDLAGFIGDGTSTYGGITGLKNALQAGSEVTAITGNTAFSTLDLADFESMVGKLPIYAQQNAKWFISKAGWAASMLRLVDAAGGNTIADLSAGATPRFLGYEVVWSQVMNSTLTAQTSTEGLVFFGDLAQAVAFGSRRGIELAISADRYFEYDQLGIRGTERFDIVAHEVGTSSVPGSIIQLNTPAS